MSVLSSWRASLLVFPLLAGLAAPACLTEAFVDPEGFLSCLEEGLDVCGGTCVDFDSDHDHCGDCDSVCDEDETCEQSECVPVCDDAEQLCDGSCVQTTFNDEHCGECGNACESSESCLFEECIADDDFDFEPECEECPCPDCPLDWECGVVPDEGVICFEPPEEDSGE